MHNVNSSSVPQGRLTVAIVGYYSHSLTLRIKNLTWRNSLCPGVTFMTSIQSIAASSTLLSSTGEQQSYVIDRTSPKMKNMKEMEENCKGNPLCSSCPPRLTPSCLNPFNTVLRPPSRLMTSQNTTRLSGTLQC